MEPGIQTRIEQQFETPCTRELVTELMSEVGNDWRKGLIYTRIPDTLEEKWAYFAAKRRFKGLLPEVELFVREYVNRKWDYLYNVPRHVDGLVQTIQNGMMNLLASFREGYIMGRLRSCGMSDNQIKTALSAGWFRKLNGYTRIYHGDANELYYQLYEDPYLILGMNPNELHGIAEKIRMQDTIGYNLCCIVYEVVRLCQAGKHVCYPIELLDQIIPDFHSAIYSGTLAILLKKKYDCEIRDGFVYLPYHAEIEDLLYNIFTRKGGDSLDLGVNIDGRFGLDESQKAAVRCILGNRTSIITGGPGCGKSYTVRHAAELLSELRVPYYILTPSGKAALNLNKANSNLNAMTGHRFLVYLDHQDKIKSNPHIYDTKLSSSDEFITDKPRQRRIINIDEPGYVFFDESSMFDNSIIAHICRRLKGWRFVFVGDPDQLPPIQSGNFFIRAIEAGVTPMVKLTGIYRQKDKSSILDLLEKIRQNSTDFESDEYCKYHIYTEQKELKTLLASFKNDKRSVKIVCPKNDDAKKMNAMAREILLDNPTKIANNWYNGSLVMVTQNFYGLEDGFELMNGEEGEIVGGNGEFLNVHFEGKGVIKIPVDSSKVVKTDDEVGLLGRSLDDPYPISFKDRGDLTTAYLKESFAITVHASQGSEWDRVIFYSSQSPGFHFNRKLGYTAFSRAQRYLYCYAAYNFKEFVFKSPVHRYDNLGFKLTGTVPTIPHDRPEIYKCKDCEFHFECPWKMETCDKCKKKSIKQPPLTSSPQKECPKCHTMFQGTFKYCSIECNNAVKTGKCRGCLKLIEPCYQTCYNCRLNGGGES